jgi:hypothetical protein
MATKKAVAGRRQPAKADATAIAKSGQPMIFISHDDRDGALAEAWCKLLSSVSAGVLKSFRSSDKKGRQGIEYGVDWYPELMGKLDAASDVVCLLTSRSLDRPWILYEAGVAKGKLGTPVLGIAFGIPLSRASSGPFAQFQNCDDKEDSLTGLVMQLLRRIPGAEPDEAAIAMQVKAFKTDVDKLLPKLDKEHKTAAAAQKVDETTVAKLFEEVKIMFQDLPSRIESRESGDRGLLRRKYRRFHPLMFDDVGEMLGGKPGDPTGFLMLVSMLRADFPPLYEVGMEAYRALDAGNRTKAAEKLERFARLSEFLSHGVMLEEFGITSKEAHFLLRDLSMSTHEMMSRLLGAPPSRSSKKTTKQSTKKG